jgi:2-dehydropantoate 2-reductase
MIKNETTSEEITRMRVCVIGAGAMGGLLGASLLGAGIDVTLVDRGPRVLQLRQRGLTLVTPEGEKRTYRDLRVVDEVDRGADYDVVFLAVKTYDLPSAAIRLPAMVAPRAIIVTLQNGIPWWYFHRYGGELEGRRLRTVDPDGSLEKNVDADQVIGCVPYPAAELLPGGEILHVEGDKLPVGELDGTDSRRVRQVAALLEAAGFRSRVLDDLRSETWLKAWGNLAFNPLSALTGATLQQLCRFAATRSLAAAMMREAQQVAEALGSSFRVGIEQRIRGAEAVGNHKTSMLQDLESGRPLETEALIGAVIELAEIVGVPTPSVSAIHASVSLLERTRRGTTPMPIREVETGAILSTLVPVIGPTSAGVT